MIAVCGELLDALRPQPSGETRDIGAASRLTKLIEDGENLKKAYHPSTFSDPVSSFWCDVAALSTTPARAEAQDEGAAGEWPVVTDQWAETYCDLTGQNPDGTQVSFIGDGVVTTTFRDMAKRQIEVMLCAAPKSAVRAISTHPSPPPAADEDRVRADRYYEALVQADLKIRSLPGTDQSDVEFIRAVLKSEAK